jgi:hypothetical protein
MRRPTPVPLIVVLSLAALAGCSKKTTAPATEATLDGVVQHLDGTPYAHALVDAQTTVPVNGLLEITTVESDTSGAFHFGGLRAEPYTLSVIQLDSLAVADTVTAPGGGIVLRMRPAAVLRGVAIRPDPGDLSAVSVWMVRPPASAITDPAGAYELRGVAPGPGALYAYDALSNGTASRAVIATAGDTITLDTLRIPPGSLPAPARLRVTRR